MKVTLNEFGDNFSIHLTAETLKDAVRLVRFGIKSKKKLIGKSVWASQDNDISGFIIIGKRADSNSLVEHS